MEPVALGIIGFGVIGKAHHKATVALPEKLNLVAIADLRDVARQEASEAGVKTLYRNDEELLADPKIEAVVVAAPTGVRDAIVLKALHAGKHVLFEKPPALNAATIQRYIARRGDRTVGCCSSRYTFSPSVSVIAPFVASGALGALRVVRIRATMAAGKPPTNSPPPWRQSFALNGGGFLVNWGVYDLNYMLELTNWKLVPQTIFAQTWPTAPIFADRIAPCSDAEAHFTALIRCTNGAVISFERGEFMALHTEEQWQITGTQGSLTMVMHSRKDKTIQHDEASKTEGVVSRTFWQGDDTIAPGALQADFADAIRTGRPPRCTLEQALVIQKIFDGVYASAASGRAVDIA